MTGKHLLLDDTLNTLSPSPSVDVVDVEDVEFLLLLLDLGHNQYQGNPDYNRI